MSREPYARARRVETSPDDRTKLDTGVRGGHGIKIASAALIWLSLRSRAFSENIASSDILIGIDPTLLAISVLVKNVQYLEKSKKLIRHVVKL